MEKWKNMWWIFRWEYINSIFNVAVHPVPIKPRSTCLAVLIISMHQTHARWLGSQNYGITFKKKRKTLGQMWDVARWIFHPQTGLELMNLYMSPPATSNSISSVTLLVMLESLSSWLVSSSVLSSVGMPFIDRMRSPICRMPHLRTESRFSTPCLLHWPTD